MTLSKYPKSLLFLFILFISISKGNSDLAQDIKQSLVSPCCWAGTVYDLDHNPDMEEQIEKFVAQGKTKQDILDYYVGLYGERILAIPKAEGFNMMAWGAPILASLFGILFLFLYLRTPKETTTEVISAPSEVQFDDEIEAELREMD